MSNNDKYYTSSSRNSQNSSRNSRDNQGSSSRNDQSGRGGTGGGRNNDNDLPPIREVFPEYFPTRAATPANTGSWHSAAPTYSQNRLDSRPFQMYGPDMTILGSSDRPSVPTRSTRYDDPSRKHACDHDGCGKLFPTPSALQTHQNTHTGARPYTCAHCRKSFSVLSNLRRHEHTHGASSAYTDDDQASKSYYSSSSRRK